MTQRSLGAVLQLAQELLLDSQEPSVSAMPLVYELPGPPAEAPKDDEAEDDDEEDGGGAEGGGRRGRLRTEV